MTVGRGPGDRRQSSLTIRIQTSKIYVLNTKLTLLLDDGLISRAKDEARRRGTSLSKMVADYFRGVSAHAKGEDSLPRMTGSLLGSLKGKRADREAYRRHLEEKYR